MQDPKPQSSSMQRCPSVGTFTTLFRSFRGLHFQNDKLAVIMVGVPARGKSYIARKLKRFLCWMGYVAKVFNVGDRRRQQLPDSRMTADFFGDDPAKLEVREQLALGTLDEMLDWLEAPGNNIAIHDATNTTRARRARILEQLDCAGIKALLIETLCTDAELIELNIQLKLKSPDYTTTPPEIALADFRKRMALYEAKYEPLDPEFDAETSYVKLINVCRQVNTNNINGYLQSQIVMFLMNYHIQPRAIWITRHGESEWNVSGKLGGDSNLSPKGQTYAKALAAFVKQQDELQDALIWTSTLLRTHQTIQYFGSQTHRSVAMAKLNEIHAGKCEGMTYEEIRVQLPEEFELRAKDKLKYRYPTGGESYMDLITRIQPLICELERMTETVMIVAHQAVIRTFLAYFIGVEIQDLPHLEVPLHQVFRLTPTPHGCLEEKFIINLEQFERGDAVFWQKKESFYAFQ